MAKSKANNIKANEREQMVFHRDYDPMNYKHGGICRFDGLTLDTVQELIRKGFLARDERQNESPTVAEFMSFVKEHNPSNWIFHGYVVSPERDDCRVTIEGIESNGALTKDDLVDFFLLFSAADEIDADRDKPVYCWYD